MWISAYKPIIAYYALMVAFDLGNLISHWHLILWELGYNIYLHKRTFNNTIILIVRQSFWLPCWVLWKDHLVPKLSKINWLHDAKLDN